jgi:murein DD-endopeptidase MepM/ murein hydrolase activator NlpD
MEQEQTPGTPPNPEDGMQKPEPHTRRTVLFVVAGCVLLVGGFFVARTAVRPRPACGPDLPCADSSYSAQDSLAGKELLASVLARWSIPAELINQTYSALARTEFNFRNMKPGEKVTLQYRGLSLTGLEYHKDLVTSYAVTFDSSGATAERKTRPVDTLRAVVRGVIKGSLWTSMIEQGELPALVVQFAEILSYEVDFLTECNEGDSFELLLDRCYVDSAFYRNGRIHAVHYRGQTGNFYGFYFRAPNGHWDYYNEKGQSLRKTVLRSPLTFAKVTSHFGNRFHPILRTYRRHHGVDYGAPTGTPVSAIADGTVTKARWSGGYGNLVEIRHSGGLVSRYGHLSRYGPGIRSGRSIRQGQTVGYVGSTGLATGPHLHFEVHQGGRPVNPLKVIPPRAEPVAKKDMPEFERLKAGYLAQLQGPVGPVHPAVADSGQSE